MSCDSVIFQFLLDYCKEIYRKGGKNQKEENTTVKAKLTTRLLFPVFVSCEFLKIDKLITECLTFWRKNFVEVMS